MPGDRLAQVDALLASITDDDRIRSVTEPVYRPEAYAFGGDQAMTIARTLFHSDSRHVLGRLATAGGTHRRGFGVLLATRLMRAAGLEFSGQCGVWRLLASRRHLAARDGGRDRHLPLPVRHPIRLSTRRQDRK
ncbi:thiopeptide-type bacteriocin biosynthesis protein [Micromonospora sp. LOL_021]|uniref:thiopeptide-type bacteriocin biosynthesis protein n=1 Tax=Micromonospora sp. LOL_021 TaxID=3345417 RepID=UPI003A8A98E2